MNAMIFFELLKVFVVVLVGCFYSCGDDNEIPAPNEELKEETIITCSVNNIVFDSDCSVETISFSANEDWTIKVLGNVTWCEVSPSFGNAGTHSVNVSVDENNTNIERDVTLAILCDDISYTIIVSQKQQNAFILSSEKIEVASNGGQIEIGVKTNVDYEIEIADDATQWIEEVTARSMSSYLHVFSIEANENLALRRGKIQFKTSEKTYLVEIFQEGGADEPVLILDRKECIVGASGETIAIEVKSNVDFGVKMPDVDWIRIKEDARSFSNHTLKYIVLPNETYNDREAEIVVYDRNSDLEETFRLVQKQRDLLRISKKHYELNSKKDTIEVEVETNIDFEIGINMDWITLIKQVEISVRKQILFFEIDENLMTEDRKGKILIVNKEKEMEQVVEILQKMETQSSSDDKEPDGNIDNMLWG